MSSILKMYVPIQSTRVLQGQECRCVNVVSQQVKLLALRTRLSLLLNDTISLVHQLMEMQWHAGVSSELSPTYCRMCVGEKRRSMLPDGEGQLCHQSLPFH